VPEPILPALCDLIGFDSAGFLWMDLARELDYLPPQDLVPGGEDFRIMSLEDENALWWEHHNSVCCQPRVPDDLPSVLTETDTKSVRQWHACSLYVNLFKPGGDEHLLILRIPTVPDEHSGCFVGEAPEKPSPNETRPIYSCSSRTLRRHTGVVNTCAQCRR